MCVCMCHRSDHEHHHHDEIPVGRPFHDSSFLGLAAEQPEPLKWSVSEDTEVRDACQQRSVSALQHTRLISDIRRGLGEPTVSVVSPGRRAEDWASPADRAELIKAEETTTQQSRHDRDAAARFPSGTVCSAGSKLVRSLVWLTAQLERNRKRFCLISTYFGSRSFVFFSPKPSVE